MAVPIIKGHQIIDLRNDANYYFEVVPQGDGQARGILVEVLDNGSPVTFDPTVNTVTIDGINAGGYEVHNTCSFESGHTPYNNFIDVSLLHILDYPGLGKYTITIHGNIGEDYVNTFPFNIVVIPSPYNIDTVTASDTYQALNDAIVAAMTANRWWTKEGPPSSPDSNAHLGDYYLDASSGKIYYSQASTDPYAVNWFPLQNSDGSQVVLGGSTFTFIKTLSSNATTLTLTQDNYIEGTLPSWFYSISNFDISVKSTNNALSLSKNPTVTINSSSHTVSIILNFTSKLSSSTTVYVELSQR